MPLEITVNRTKCMGSGNCQFWAPAVFELGEDGIAFVADPEGDPEERVRLAAEGCPTNAIEIGGD